MIQMSTFLAIRALLDEGTPKREISRRLSVDVRTVRRYCRSIASGDSEPRKSVSASKLDFHRERIVALVAQDFSATQIFQQLSARDDFHASYPTLRRLVRRLRKVEPEVFRRLHFRPGEEGQIDFGSIGTILVGGVPRRVHLFVLTLCFSRLAYYELVLDQTVPTFLGAIRRAFEFFGGVPERIKPDNLKSAVLLDQLGQRYYQEDFFRFCRYYGTLPDAARPATPTDKGRCERDIGYAKGNCFRGHHFSSLEEAREHLLRWRRDIADVRIHGTTQRRPIDLFEEERAHLRPLPAEPFEICRLAHYRVRKDCHIRVDGNYYSVPHTLVGERVTARVSEDTITVFAHGKIAAEHVLARGRGETVTIEDHYPPTKRLATQEIHRQRSLAVRAAGPHATAFAHALRQGPWVVGPQLGLLVGLLAGYGPEALDLACRRALHFGAVDGAAVIQRILERGLQNQALPGAVVGDPSARGADFGRPLSEYAALLDLEAVSA
jgi:transposase